jgi:predicted metal-dependent hydrolase
MRRLAKPMNCLPNRTEPTTSAFWNETPIRTYLFDSLSILLPSGEAFVNDAVRAAMNSVPPESDLAGACRRLVAEELSHQRAHRKYNDRLTGQGYGLAVHERAVASDLSRLAARLSADQRLRLAAAFEHITATIARAALGDRGLLAKSGAPQCRTWQWHCAEEAAHVGVTRDLLGHRQIGYASRVAWFALALSMLTTLEFETRSGSLDCRSSSERLAAVRNDMVDARDAGSKS